MGFFDGLGDFMSSMVGQMAAQGQKMKEWRAQYESWSDADLKREYKKLQNGDSMRRSVVRQILQDRGLIRRRED